VLAFAIYGDPLSEAMLITKEKTEMKTESNNFSGSPSCKTMCEKHLTQTQQEVMRLLAVYGEIGGKLYNLKSDIDEVNELLRFHYGVYATKEAFMADIERSIEGVSMSMLIDDFLSVTINNKIHVFVNYDASDPNTAIFYKLLDLAGEDA
jgi:hypothetical protein